MGFLDEKGLEIVGYNSAQMSTRSSEIPFAQASNSLLRPVWILAARLSEPRANQERVKSQPSSFASLKRNSRRLSERRQFLPRILEMACSLKRTRSEPQARKNQTYVIWLAQARSCSLKRAGSCATQNVIFLRCSKPKPKLPRLIIGFLENFWSDNIVDWRCLWCIYGWILYEMKWIILC